MDRKENIKQQNNKLNEFIYCGVEYSICDRNFIFHNHSLCCLKCEYDCKGCTVNEVSQCDMIYSKKQIILNKVEKLSEEKEKHIIIIDNINKEIQTLLKEIQK